MMVFKLAGPAATALLLIFVSTSSAQEIRTWVSGTGNDANPCTLTQPCRTFARAIERTAAGGEITVLDPDDFGPATITKSLTIDGGVGRAGRISNATTDGIVINAAAADTVTLRNLVIHGFGAGLNGIRIAGAGSVHIESCEISDQLEKGVDAAPATYCRIAISDCIIRDNAHLASGGGIRLKPVGSGIIQATLKRVQLINNTYGLRAEANTLTTITDSLLSCNRTHGAVAVSAVINLDRCTICRNTSSGLRSVYSGSAIRFGASTIEGNSIGLETVFSGRLLTYRNNHLAGNTTDGVPTGSADLGWTDFLRQPILAGDQTAQDVVSYVGPRLPTLQVDPTIAAWEQTAAQLRTAILDRVVYKGEAARWRDAATRVEWLETIEGGPGYRLRKLRYEALPGLWVSAVLYEPENLTGRVPVVLNVQGHFLPGIASDFQQLRCINFAKRGMLALSVDWFNTGSLRTANLNHLRMNQLDLCGTSGLAPFYLSMNRGLNLLLSLPNADPERVAMAGLSGGGWQTIVLGALDPRVTLINPVAGYSAFQTRLQNWKDLGDSEQTPLDLATIADYTHLTAMTAPRPCLLTYNTRDNCCFESNYALPPLLNAGRPAYALYGKTDYLQSHENADPGTHNFDKDNREALYAMMATHFSRPGVEWPVTEIDSTNELKTGDQLTVALPQPNADFNSLALDIYRQFPPPENAPADPAQRDAWIAANRTRLRAQVVYRSPAATATLVRQTAGEGWTARAWLLQMDNWHVPVVEIAPANPVRTRIVIADGGRPAATQAIDNLLMQQTRVLAVDPLGFGECLIPTRAYLFALMINTVGERPLGIQSGQLNAVANWARHRWQKPVGVTALGPRTSCIGTVAAAVDPEPVTDLALDGALNSLSTVLTSNMNFDAAPELFCAGLLATCDLPVIRQLIAPGVLD